MHEDLFNLAEYVLRAGAAVPDKCALAILAPDHIEEWTFAALRAAVQGTAQGLLTAGLMPGDIVLMRLGNTVDFPIAYLGALAAGLVPVPTAAQLTTIEVGKIISNLTPKAILHDPRVPCPSHSSLIDLHALREMRALSPAPWHMGARDRLGYIIYTSGTSGKPSAVMHAHRAILARQMMFDGWYGLTSADRVLHAGAFNWTYTLGTGLMDPWTCGATALIPQAQTLGAALPDLIQTNGATIFAAAPGVYRQMLKNATPFQAPDLRHGLSAGEKLAPQVREAWDHQTGTPIYEAFGMSECSTFISSAPGRPAAAGALGAAQPGRRVQIMDEDGPVATGNAGTIAIHNSDPGLMLGYFDAPNETQKKHQGEWFLTGDQGVMDAEGQITYLGRNDDMMNAGGFRVSPLEVEATLAGMSGIDAVGVTEVEVKAGVKVIAAFYTSVKALDADACAAYAQTYLARYKQPRLYIHLPTLPTGANGKLLRRALRTQYEAQNDQND